MYLYNIGYGTCEESEYNQYSHAEEYSEKQLEDIVVQCLCETIEWYTGRFDKDGEHEPLLFVREKGVSFQELMSDEHFHTFLKDKGFVPVEFAAKFSCFGWASALNSDDWSGHTDDDDRKIQERIKKTCEGKGIILEQYTDKTGDKDSYRLNWKNS